MALVALVGTERTLHVGAKVVGKVNPNAVSQVTVHVAPEKDRARAAVESFATQLTDAPLSERHYLTRSEFATQFGASRQDFQSVRKFARQYGLHVVRDRLVKETGASQLGHRTLELRGTNVALSRAFGVKLVRVKEAKKLYRTYIGSLSIPEPYQDVIENVFGLDTRPPAKPRLKIYSRTSGFSPHTGAVSFDPPQVAQLYNYPSSVNGKGQTIALVELGGGFRRSDLKTYFRKLGLTPPMIKAVNVLTGGNRPTGNPNGPDAEVMLDIEVVGAVAPGVKLVVYFAPNTNRGFFRCVNAIVQDNVHKPNILSISWGGPESTWSAADLTSFNEVFQAAAVMGITVFVASGDDGSTDGVAGSAAHVDFPASSPFVTACGGTRLISQGSGAITETVWNDGASGGGTGGGISAFFPVPPYQNTVPMPASPNPGAGPGRGVPDVAGNADPVTGYNVRIDGVNTVVGGTSAVAPLWAGLTALINETLGQNAGFINPFLYTNPYPSGAPVLRDVTSGNNDTTGQVHDYQASAGWDPCTGLGTPVGTAVLNAIRTAG